MNAFSYTFRIGITTAFIMPVFVFVFGLVTEWDNSEIFGIYIISFFCECIWLLPAMFILWICASVVSIIKLKVSIAKTWLSIALILMTYLPLLIIFGPDSITKSDLESTSYIIIHTSILIALIWLYYLRIETRPGINEADGEVRSF